MKHTLEHAITLPPQGVGDCFFFFQSDWSFCPNRAMLRSILWVLYVVLCLLNSRQRGRFVAEVLISICTTAFLDVMWSKKELNVENLFHQSQSHSMEHPSGRSTTPLWMKNQEGAFFHTSSIVLDMISRMEFWVDGEGVFPWTLF